MTVEQAVQVYFIGAIQYGQIIIRYENGKPTHVERREVTRLTEEAVKP